MKYRNVLTSVAVAVVWVASGTANAQLLGGGAQGGLGGSIAGGLGNVGAAGGGAINGALRGGTDALGRTREIGSRVTDRAKDTAASADAAGEAGPDVDVATDHLSSEAAGNVTGDGSGMLGLGSQEAAVAEPVVNDQEPSTPRRDRAKGKRQQPPASKVKPTQEPQPRPQVKANGKASGNGGLEASGDGGASANANANASADAYASVDK
jgi:hypothetical protein